MKKYFLMFAFVATVFAANAQEVTKETVTVTQTTPTTGDYYQGFTRPQTFNRMIPPPGLPIIHK